MTQQQVVRIFLLLSIALFTLTAGVRAYAPERQTRSHEKAHRHIGTDKSTRVDIPEFSMVETTLEPTAKKENLITSRSRTYAAFTVSGTRLFVAERRTQKIFEVSGLPLEWRPFSDLHWTNNETLVFDRWSQPHYGVHYAVNVRSRKLVIAMPFGDKFYRDQQRPKRQHNRKPPASAKSPTTTVRRRGLSNSFRSFRMAQRSRPRPSAGWFKHIRSRHPRNAELKQLRRKVTC